MRFFSEHPRVGGVAGWTLVPLDLSHGGSRYVQRDHLSVLAIGLVAAEVVRVPHSLGSLCGVLVCSARSPAAHLVIAEYRGLRGADRGGPVS